MKPPRFEYFAPTSLDEALGLLAEHGDEAKVLAGGQSLVPLLNFRLVRPGYLVDLNEIPGLDGLREENGWLLIGGMTRQRAAATAKNLWVARWRGAGSLASRVAEVGSGASSPSVSNQ